VIGAGAVGQFVIQGLRIAGAAENVAVDPSASRRGRRPARGERRTRGDPQWRHRGDHRPQQAGRVRRGRSVDLVAHEKALVGSIYGSGDPVEMGGRLLSRIADRTLTIEGMIGETFVLDDVNAAVDLALTGTGGRVLLILDPNLSEIRP
jgi:Zn-dependent alcohol dehydrogenase